MTEFSENEDLCSVVKDWVFTLKGETYLGDINFNPQWDVAEFDVTNVVNDSIKKDKQISFILMERHKENEDVVINSRENTKCPPKLELKYNCKAQSIKACKDTYIQAGDKEKVNFGKEKQLLVRDSGNPYDDEWKKAYLQFDLNDCNDKVDSAVLKLYGKSQTNNKKLMIFKNEDISWDEYILTFGNHKGKTFTFDEKMGGYSWIGPKAADVEYQWQIPRFDFAKPLLSKYIKFNDEKCARVYIDFMLHFIRKMKEKAGMHPRSLDCAIRAINWIEAYDIFIKNNLIKEEESTAIKDTFYKTALFLEESYHPQNNWGFIETLGLYNICVYFKEFDKSLEWRKLAEKRFYDLINRLSYEDGAYTEASTSYASSMISCSAAFKNIAVTNNIEFNKNLDEKIIKLVKYYIDTSFPNGMDIVLGDGGMDDKREKVLDMVSLYKDDYMKYFATGGEKGKKPKYTSVIYPVHKSAVMRTGWDENDTYLHINVNQSKSHRHPDELSIILYGYKNPLIVDPGAYTYSDEPKSNWLRFTTEAHNTVVVNGGAQNSDEGLINTWLSNAFYDYFEGQTPSYPGFLHTRSVMFIKPEFFIVSDYVKNSKKGSNKFEQNWHFKSDANITFDKKSKCVKTNFKDGGNINIIQMDKDVSGVIKDGYYSEVFYKVNDAKYISYVKKCKGNATYDTILFPTKEGQNIDISIKVLNGGAAKAYKIMFNDKRYAYYYINHADEQSTMFGSFEIRAKAAYIEFENEKIQRMYLVDGSNIIYKGNTIFTSLKPVNIAANYDNGYLNIEYDGNQSNEFKVFTKQSNEVFVNEEYLDYKRK